MIIKSNWKNQLIKNKVVRSQANSFEFNDVSPLVTETQVAPKLLTALFGGMANSTFLDSTNVVQFDQLIDSIQLRLCKRFDEFGPDIQKDKATNRFFEVGSFGYRTNVAPGDYSGKRIPGSNEMMDQAYLVGRMAVKMDKGWSLLRSWLCTTYHN